jgi:hypothetical protein
MAGGLDAVVEGALDGLPDGVAVRLDDHRPPDEAVLGQVGAPDHVAVPGGKVLVGTGKGTGTHGP